jgi:aryl-alcohol dehydrogenase-like predicted oxidoreductase
VTQAARDAGGATHHFAVIELPLNLLESDALLRPHAPHTEPLLTIAERLGIAVLAQRPLNAFVGATPLRLADLKPLPKGLDANDAAARVKELEGEYRSQFAERLQVSIGGKSPRDFFNFGELLLSVIPDLESEQMYAELERRVIAPNVARLLETVLRAMPEGDRAAFVDWQKRYVSALNALLGAARQAAQNKSRTLLDRVRAALGAAGAPADLAMSRAALAAVSGLPQVRSTLVGMRQRVHVEDALRALELPRAPAMNGWFAAIEQQFSTR